MAWLSEVVEEESRMIGPQALCAPMKKKHPLEKFEGGSSVWKKACVRTKSLRSTSSGKRYLHVRKRERNLKIENPSKISTAQTVFLLKFWSCEKFCVFKKEINCKDYVSSIVKFIEWTLLHASVWRLRYFYSSKRKRKKEKRERRNRTVERHFCLMFSGWFYVAGILKRKERKKNCFFNLIIICLIIAY